MGLIQGQISFRSPGAGGAGIEGRSVEVPTVHLGDSESSAVRLHVGPSETLTVTEAGVQDAGNSLPSGIYAIVKNETLDEVVYSANTKRESGTLATVDGEADVSLRTKNRTGGIRNVNGQFVVDIE